MQLDKFIPTIKGLTRVPKIMELFVPWVQHGLVRIVPVDRWSCLGNNWASRPAQGIVHRHVDSCVEDIWDGWQATGCSWYPNDVDEYRRMRKVVPDNYVGYMNKYYITLRILITLWIWKKEKKF